MEIRKGGTSPQIYKPETTQQTKQPASAASQDGLASVPDSLEQAKASNLFSSAVEKGEEEQSEQDGQQQLTTDEQNKVGTVDYQNIDTSRVPAEDDGFHAHDKDSEQKGDSPAYFGFDPGSGPKHQTGQELGSAQEYLNSKYSSNESTEASEAFEEGMEQLDRGGKTSGLADRMEALGLGPDRGPESLTDVAGEDPKGRQQSLKSMLSDDALSEAVGGVPFYGTPDAGPGDPDAGPAGPKGNVDLVHKGMEIPKEDGGFWTGARKLYDWWTNAPEKPKDDVNTGASKWYVGPDGEVHGAEEVTKNQKIVADSKQVGQADYLKAFHTGGSSENIKTDEQKKADEAKKAAEEAKKAADEAAAKAAEEAKKKKADEEAAEAKKKAGGIPDQEHQGGELPEGYSREGILPSQMRVGNVIREIKGTGSTGGETVNPNPEAQGGGRLGIGGVIPMSDEYSLMGNPDRLASQITGLPTGGGAFDGVYDPTEDSGQTGYSGTTHTDEPGDVDTSVGPIVVDRPDTSDDDEDDSDK